MVEPQYQFAAEFALFLVALAGASLTAFRGDLVTRAASARLVLTVGFVALGGSAFLHGSLLAGAGSAEVLGLRGAGAVLILLGLVGWGGTALSRNLVAVSQLVVGAEIALTAGKMSAGAAGARVLAAVLLGLGLLAAARRSIAARVAAGAAITLLVIVLVLSVGLSAVLTSRVEDEAIRRLAFRAENEAAQIVTDEQRSTIKGARVAVDALSGLQGAVERVAADPSPDPALAARLERLSREVLSGLPIAFVTTDGVVVAAAGLEPGSFVPVAGSRVFQEAVGERHEVGAVDVIDGRPVVVAVSPLVVNVDGVSSTLGGVVAMQLLDSGYLDVQIADDRTVGLALANRSGTLAAFNEPPERGAVEAVVDDVFGGGDTAVRVTDDRFVAAAPVLSGDGTPVLAVVASQPTTAVDAIRRDLFQTLFLIALGGSVLALLLAAVMGERIGAGLRRLTVAATAIQAGRFETRARVESADEVGVLSDAFDSMASSIEEKTEALRQAAEDEARLRNRLEAVVAGMGEALVAVDESGAITDFNRAAEDLFGVAEAEAMRRPLSEVVSVIGDDGSDLATRATSPTAGPWAALGTARADDEDVPIAVTAGPLRDAEGRTTGTVLVVRDLRHEREVEQMKREFLSRVGHELRTPLAPIIGFSRILATRDDVPSDRAQELHDTMYRSAKRLERIVEMLEFFASLEAGRQVVEPEVVDVRELLGEVVARREPSLDDTHRLVRRIGRGLPPVLADRKWLGRAVDELIDNAVKFSPEGGPVTVRAEIDEDDVVISVTDKGTGMSPDEVEAAFSEWTQGDSSDTRSYGGLGLGLALVRRVVERHGGFVRCTSDVGKGSKFSIRLPAVPMDEVDGSTSRARGGARRPRRRMGVRPR